MGGDLAMLVHCPEGTVGHYLNGRFGKNYGGRLFNPEGKGSKAKAKENRRIIARAPKLGILETKVYSST